MPEVCCPASQGIPILYEMPEASEMTWLRKIKAPYAAVTVLVLVAISIYLMAQGTVDSTAFKVGAVLIGGLVTRAAIAVAIGALNTAVLMVVSAFVLLGAGVELLHADTFKDHAIEGVAVGAATAALMVVGEMLARHQKQA